MDIKPGKETSEFQMTAVLNVVNAVVMLFILYGVFTAEEAAVWVQAVTAVLVLVLPIASAVVTKEYSMGRTALKLETMIQEGMQPVETHVREEAA